LTTPTNNPPQASTPTPPGKAMLVARLIIAVGLCAGIAVFAVFTIKQLEAGQSAPTLPSDFGTSKTSPDDAAESRGDGPLPGLGGTDPTKYIPIVRENPHPGRFAPFLRADPFGQVPYREPIAGGIVVENCAYRVNDASLADLFAHYHDQAEQVGMKLTKQKETSKKMPGGIEAAWSDGRRSLRVTAQPLAPSQPAAPPLRPETPLQWVVQYSYPATGQ